ncbi:phosphatase 2C-like domain-containing protein [Paraphysoderma sedebokerense]|nr:phosphatase 2C-like domain-containing protein [Paraphysoderma sedebokerense]
MFDNVLTDQQIERILTENEKCINTNYGPIQSIHTNSLASNEPNEDYFSLGYHQGRFVFGIFDGHGGPHCGAVLKEYLASYVLRAVENVNVPTDSETRIKLVSKAIVDAFNRLDGELTVIPAKLFPRLSKGSAKTPMDIVEIRRLLAPSLSGAVGISVYLENNILYVANCGDCRCLLGRKNDDGSCAILEMSREHDCTNEDEVKRLHQMHPGEERTIIRSHPIAGGSPITAAFGDNVYKWPKKWQETILPAIRKKRGRSNETTPDHYFTPPYLTSTPEITYRKLQKGDRFLVLATDGLFDDLNNEEVVWLVSQHLDKFHNRDLFSSPLSSPTTPTSNLSPDSPSQKHKPSVRHPRTVTSSSQYWQYNDEPLSTHLIRNALGGADRQRLSHLLSMKYPKSRDFRDDVTVLVVVFDEDFVNGLSDENVTKETDAPETIEGIEVIDLNKELEIPIIE